MRAVVLFIALSLAACSAPHGVARRGPVSPTPAGLVSLPCDGKGPLKPRQPGYCWLGRAYVTPDVRKVLSRVAAAFARIHPGSTVMYMDASGADGIKPFKPHLSHGDGREVDLAVFYRTTAGQPLGAPPTFNGYGAYEPPRPGDPVACRPRERAGDDGDPGPGRPWRLDEARTRDLVTLLSATPEVRRLFIEPHLKRRFGLDHDPKVRFAGCQAARHDDHVHVDFS